MTLQTMMITRAEIIAVTPAHTSISLTISPASNFANQAVSLMLELDHKSSAHVASEIRAVQINVRTPISSHGSIIGKAPPLPECHSVLTFEKSFRPSCLR